MKRHLDLLLLFFVLIFGKIENSYAKQDILSPPPIPEMAPLNIPPSAMPAIDKKQENKEVSKQDDTKEKVTLNKSRVEKKKNRINTEDIKDVIFNIGTSFSDGAYYPLGSTLCLYYNMDYNGGFAANPYCRAEMTSGSIANIEELKNAKLSLALVKANWQKQALNGTGPFQEIGKFENLRFVMSLHNESLAIIVKRDSDIKELNDLNNKVVNIGAPGSSIRLIMEDIIKAKGWSYNTFKNITELAHKDEVEALCLGQIDAMVMITEHPNTYIQKVTSLCETNIININDNDIVNFIRANNDYDLMTIPGKMYLGIPHDIKTIGVKATLVATTDTSKDMVYNIVASTVKHLSNLKQISPALHDIDTTNMFNSGKIAPMHSGVIEYLKKYGSKELR